jgi:hypothetical protein
MGNFPGNYYYHNFERVYQIYCGGTKEMKDLWKGGVLILLIIGVLYIIFLRECKHPLPCPPKGQVIIDQSTWDSILALANKPSEVTIDTFWLEKPIVIPDIQPPIPSPQINPADTTIKIYADSLVNKEVSVHYDFKVRGVLLIRKWSYRPITVEIRKDSIVYVPNIVPVDKPVPVKQNGLYGNVVFGGNKDAFLFGGGLDFLTKKDTEIGYMYQRFGDQNFHSIKLGGKIKFRK